MPSSDVYIACREMRGDFKISLHKSGECNAGFTARYAKGLLQDFGVFGGPRHVEQWFIRRPVATPVLAAKFFVPASQLRLIRENSSASANIHWIPQPANDQSVCVEVVFARKDDFFTEQSCGRNILATWHLFNGDSVWIAYRTIETPSGVVGAIEDSRNKERTKLDGRTAWDRTHPEGRLLLFGPNQGGWTSFIDAATS